jgi:uncharacterized membrane protein YtjA (UPF0391 family)
LPQARRLFHLWPFFTDRVYRGHAGCSGLDAAGTATQNVDKATASASTQPYRQSTLLEGFMLRYAVIFFIIAIIAAFFGFGGIASGATEIAKILFFIFIVIFLATLLLGVFRR